MSGYFSKTGNIYLLLTKQEVYRRESWPRSWGVQAERSEVFIQDRGQGCPVQTD